MVGLKVKWPQAPAQRELRDGEIHVWAVLLQQSAERVAICQRLLAADERARAAKYHFDRDRNRFIAARGSLRSILAGYTGVDPGALEFKYGPRGKPELVEGSGGEGLFFNLAHSDELALVAVTRLGNLGVDMERLRPMEDAENIATRFFSARESAGFSGLAERERERAFFNLWTRKEAWLKATGEGITESLSKAEVTFLAGEPAQLIRIGDDALAAGLWSLHALEPAEGFVGALAAPSGSRLIECWSWVG